MKHAKHDVPRQRDGVRQRRTGSKSWEIRWQVIEPDGTRRFRQETVQGDRRDAERALRARRSAVDSGAYVDPTRVTFGEHLRGWLDDRKTRLAPQTWRRYDNLARHQILPRLASVPLSKLTPSRLRAFYAEALRGGAVGGGPLSTTTVRQAHAVIRASLQTAVRERMLMFNPATAIEAPPKRKAEIRALDRGQLLRLLDALRASRYYVPALLGGVCGLRRGEALAARWRDADLEAGTLAVRRSLQEVRGAVTFKEPKSGRSRAVAVPSTVVEALRAHKAAQNAQRLLMGAGWADEDLIVTRVDGRPWNPANFSPRFAVAAAKAGFPNLGFHALRHSAATLMLELGLHPKVVQETLGHSTITLTMDTYSHVAPTLQREAADAVDAALRIGAKG